MHMQSIITQVTYLKLFKTARHLQFSQKLHANCGLYCRTVYWFNHGHLFNDFSEQLHFKHQ